MAVVLGEPPVVVDAGGGVDSPACVASRAAWGNGVVREGGDCARGVGALTTAGGTTFLGVAWRSASRRLANAMLGEPALIESEKHYRNVLRLFSDVLSAVFDGYHHPGCTSSEYEALDTLRTLDTEL